MAVHRLSEHLPRRLAIDSKSATESVVQDRMANVAILVTIAVFSVGVVIAAVSIVRSSWQPRSAVVARALAHARRFVQVWEQLGMQCKLKQAIGLYQGASASNQILR
eukprot:6191359-Pleurochrysis_carterae.AAC.9